MERTQNKSQDRRVNSGEEILPPLLPGFELATFRSRVQRFYQQAIPAPRRLYFDDKENFRCRGQCCDYKEHLRCRRLYCDDTEHFRCRGQCCDYKEHLRRRRLYRDNIAHFRCQGQCCDYKEHLRCRRLY